MPMMNLSAETMQVLTSLLDAEISNFERTLTEKDKHSRAFVARVQKRLSELKEVKDILTEFADETPQERTTRKNIEAITETFTDEQLLELAQGAQTLFWNAVSDLENAVGFSIDSTNDLSNYTIETLDQAEEK